LTHEKGCLPETFQAGDWKIYTKRILGVTCRIHLTMGRGTGEIKLVSILRRGRVRGWGEKGCAKKKKKKK